MVKGTKFTVSKEAIDGLLKKIDENIVFKFLNEEIRFFEANKANNKFLSGSFTDLIEYELSVESKIDDTSLDRMIKVRKNPLINFLLKVKGDVRFEFTETTVIVIDTETPDRRGEYKTLQAIEFDEQTQVENIQKLMNNTMDFSLKEVILDPKESVKTEVPIPRIASATGNYVIFTSPKETLYKVAKTNAKSIEWKVEIGEDEVSWKEIRTSIVNDEEQDVFNYQIIDEEALEDYPKSFSMTFNPIAIDPYIERLGNKILMIIFRKTEKTWNTVLGCLDADEHLRTMAVLLTALPNKKKKK